MFLDGQAMAEACSAMRWRPTTSWSAWRTRRHAAAQRAESIEEAIRHSGVGVEQSLAAFRWAAWWWSTGPLSRRRSHVRRGAAVVTLQQVPQLGAAARAIVGGRRPGRGAAFAGGARARSIDYQDEAYAKRYAEVIKRVVAAEQKVLPGSQLSEAAARYLYKADGVQG